MNPRLLVGVSAEATARDVRAALLRVTGHGPDCRVQLLEWTGLPRGSPDIAFTMAQCANDVARRTPLREAPILALGWRAAEPATSGGDSPVDLGLSLAERTGLTTIGRFEVRDQAAADRLPLEPVVDALVARTADGPRIFVHLDDATSVSLAAKAAVPDRAPFVAGPGIELLDLLIQGLTGQRQLEDPRGLLAVQGRQIKPLAQLWTGGAELPRLLRNLIGSQSRQVREQFVAETKAAAVAHGASAADVLCTAHHLIAAQVENAVRQVLARDPSRPPIVITGRGSSNGFLLRLLQDRLSAAGCGRCETWGPVSAAYRALTAGVLASLMLDGVATNPPAATQDSTARLRGCLVPGLPANWRRCVDRMAGMDTATTRRAA
jgi:1,6-anhydro-N-acetylmuramate kinase